MIKMKVLRGAMKVVWIIKAELVNSQGYWNVWGLWVIVSHWPTCSQSFQNIHKLLILLLLSLPCSCSITSGLSFTWGRRAASSTLTRINASSWLSSDRLFFRCVFFFQIYIAHVVFKLRMNPRLKSLEVALAFSDGLMRSFLTMWAIRSATTGFSESWNRRSTLHRPPSFSFFLLCLHFRKVESFSCFYLFRLWGFLWLLLMDSSENSVGWFRGSNHLEGSSGSSSFVSSQNCSFSQLHHQRFKEPVH